MINLAIIGMGGWGKNLVKAVQNDSDRVSFSRVVSRNPSQLKDFSAEFGLDVTDQYDDALGESSIDGIVIAGPANIHADQAAKAFAAGKHVMVIKPLALKKSEGDAMRDAAVKQGKVLALGHDRCFLPATMELRKRVAAGDLGEIIHAEGNFCVPRYFNVTPGDWKSADANAPPGSLTDHMLYTLIELIGPVKALSVQARKFVTTVDLSDSASVSLQFEGGATGSLTAIGVTPTYERLHVFGTKGWAEIRNRTRFEFCPIEGDTVVTDMPAAGLLKLQLEAFADAIEGKKPYPVTPDVAANSAAVMEALLKSKDTGDTVTV